MNIIIKKKAFQWRIQYILLFILLICSIPPTIGVKKDNIDGFSNNLKTKFTNWINGDDYSFPSSSLSYSSTTTNTLSIIEISEMRVRDIKRRLARHHGYGADEIAMMLDKKELINALAFEEHKVEQKEKDRKKRVALRRSIIVALVCVIVVMFKGLFVHAWEVACVNFVVYTDKKKYEWSRCREMKSIKALFGLFLMFTIDLLQLWLTTSVLLSWVMKSKYFFPIPYIPIKPAALLASAAGGGMNDTSSTPFANYGINVGSMVISAVFRFAYNWIEGFMGKALSDAYKRQKKERKAARKEEERLEAERLRQERKAARRARREERELRKRLHEEHQRRQMEELKEKEKLGDGDQQNEVQASQEIGDETFGNENIPIKESNQEVDEIGGMDELD